MHLPTDANQSTPFHRLLQVFRHWYCLTLFQNDPEIRSTALPACFQCRGIKLPFFMVRPTDRWVLMLSLRLLGFRNMLGKNEYGKEADFDGVWGIWDEPFFQFFAHEMNKMQEPFATTIFSVSSHHPYESSGKIQREVS